MPGHFRIWATHESFMKEVLPARYPFHYSDKLFLSVFYQEKSQALIITATHSMPSYIILSQLGTGSDHHGSIVKVLL